MARFSNLSYDADQQTVTLGVGLTWERVYELLEPLGVMVVGGRIKPVGRYNSWGLNAVDGFHYCSFRTQVSEVSV